MGEQFLAPTRLSKVQGETARAAVTNAGRMYQFIINIRIRQSAQPTAKFKKSFSNINALRLPVYTYIQLYTNRISFKGILESCWTFADRACIGVGSEGNAGRVVEVIGSYDRGGSTE